MAKKTDKTPKAEKAPKAVKIVPVEKHVGKGGKEKTIDDKGHVRTRELTKSQIVEQALQRADGVLSEAKIFAKVSRYFGDEVHDARTMFASTVANMHSRGKITMLVKGGKGTGLRGRPTRIITLKAA
jgi:hypothetical protein